MKKRLFVTFVLLTLVVLAVAPALAQDQFVFGVLLVGDKGDSGWSQAHYEGGQYVEQNVPGTKMIAFTDDFSDPAVTVQSVVSEMVDQGAKLIFTTSDAFQDDTDTVAKNFPNVVFVNASGDHVLAGTAPANVGNVMGQMEWMKEVAGCAAALASDKGNIGYLGPLIDPETRRFASSAYLGARYCYQHYKNGNPDDLVFTVTWIGFWSPGPNTLNPTQETDTFFDNGADVVMSGIDDQSALEEAGVRAKEGQKVWAVPYDFAGACDKAPEVCLGVPYFNWGPSYAAIVKSVMAGTWKQSWDWPGPDWQNINDADKSAVGFKKGPALTAEQSANLDDFIKNLADYGTNPFVPSSFALWSGPLNYQDGTQLAAAGELVKPLDVWYLSQLLQGMTGASK